MLDPKRLRQLAVVVAVTASVAIAAVAGYVGRARTRWDSFGTPGHGVNQFAGPVGIFMNSTGQTFVTDGRNARLVRVNGMAGIGWTTFGTRGNGINQFNFPFGIFVNPSDQIFVADIYRLVRVNDMTGSGWTTFGTRGHDVNQFQGLTGIFVSPAGQIFLADSGNDRIARIDDMTGRGWTTFGTSGRGVNQFRRPVSVFVNATGQIFVADAWNHRVVRFNDMTGTGWTTFDTHTVRVGYWSPTGIFVSPAGQIFMTDLGNQRIVRINDMAGTGRTTFITVGQCLESWSPGIFVSPGGAITVADYANSRIMHVTAPPAGPELIPGDRRPSNCTPPPATTGPQEPTLGSVVDPLLGQDEAKGVYEGPLGNFLVSPRKGMDWPPCPPPYRPAKNYKTSELYSPVFGDLHETWECGNGKMLLIESSIRKPDGDFILIGKSHFIGPARVPFEASLDRLVLLTVAGKPAIAQIPLPGFPALTLVVIERFPSGDQPGIQVVVEQAALSLEEAAALAAKIMGVRP
jgi:DNA-binding beta-propeller fold protein YncE